MEVIIIDSISHEWEGKGGCLESNDQLAEVKFKGNTWAAWSHTTPRHRQFIEAIIASPCHIITTMRSKTETVMTDSKRVKKVGTKDIQREGFSYEMTVSFDIDREKHMALAGKDNTHLFEDENPFVISEDDGKKILKWNKSGKKDVPTKEQTAIFGEQLKGLKMSRMKWEKATKLKWDKLTEKDADIWIKRHNLKLEKGGK